MAVFVKTVETGSLVAAGNALGMSGPMAGRHLRYLEAHLGARLLERTTRRHQVTAIGQRYYQQCRRLLIDIEATDNVAREQATLVRGRLRISAPTSFGADCLMPLISDYLTRHDSVEIDLVLSDRYVDLIEDGFDAVIRLGDITDSSLIARPLKPYRYVVCASPSYLAHRGRPDTPEDLAGHECVVFSYWSRPNGGEWEFTDSHERPITINVGERLRVNDVRALHQAARAGLGLIRGPELILRSDLQNGDLVEVLTDYTLSSRPLHILYASRYPTKTLRTFIDDVLSAFGA